MPNTRTISWTAIVQAHDPDWQQKNLNPIEYEFTAPWGPGLDPATHQNGIRIFRGFYQTRGPYATE